MEGGERWGRYSFVGYDPIVKLRAKDKVVEVINGAKVKFKTKDPVNCIKEVLAEYRVPKIGGIPPLTGGFCRLFLVMTLFSIVSRVCNLTRQKRQIFLILI